MSFFSGLISGIIFTISFVVACVILIERITEGTAYHIRPRLTFSPKDNEDNKVYELEQRIRGLEHEDLERLQREKELISTVERDPSISSFNESHPLRCHDRNLSNSRFRTSSTRSRRCEGTFEGAVQSVQSPGRHSITTGTSKLDRKQRLEADRVRAMEWAQKRKERKKVR